MVAEAKQEHIANGNDEVEKLQIHGGRKRAKMQGDQTKKREYLGTEITACRTNLKCLSFNARIIMNKWDLLLATVCDLNPDIVCITESWTTNNVLDSELHLSG